MDGNLLDISIEVRTGPKVRVTSIEFSGLNKTDPDLVRRYLILGEGDILKAEDIRQSTERLSRLDFLRQLSAPEIIPEPGYSEARIRFNLNDRNMIGFEGVAGYLPDDGGYFVWYLKSNWHNFMGGGRKIGLMVDRRDKNKMLFDVTYAQPLFLVGIGTGFMHLGTRDYRDQFYEFKLDTGYELDIRRMVSTRFLLGWKNVEPADSAALAYSNYRVGFGLTIGQSDIAGTAAFNITTDWQIEYSTRQYRAKDGRITGRSVFNDIKSHLEAKSIYRPFMGVAEFLEIDFRDIESTEKPLPVSELQLFGGPGTLRGYRNDQFAARRVILMRHETRLYFSYRNYLFPFYDAAYFERYAFDESLAVYKIDDFMYGFGMGLMIGSQNRFLRLEFAWGERAAFNQPRLNLTVGDQF
jgi:outer membrane protein assembly factor BamA